VTLLSTIHAEGPPRRRYLLNRSLRGGRLWRPRRFRLRVAPGDGQGFCCLTSPGARFLSRGPV